MYIISAVAIGNGGGTTHITDPDPATWGPVRQYINGLVDGLAKRPGPDGPYVCGTHYVIDYRERTKKQLDDNPEEAFGGNVIFCMSTTVVRAAQTFTQTNTATQTNPTPIVGIVSDPDGEGFKKPTDTNICGVTAQRHQKAADVLDKLLNSVVDNPRFQKVIALCKPGYNPSDKAWGHITGSKRVPIQQYQYTGTQTIPDWLNAMPGRLANTIMLVLPIDEFFANGDAIIDMAQNQGLGPDKQKLPTFFFAPDWVRSDSRKSALGAYGVSQYTCGCLMAERVDLAWNARIPQNPNDRWIPAKDADFQWMTNETVIKTFGYKPNKQAKPNGPDHVY